MRTVARIVDANLFRKLVHCVIDQAGPEHGIASAKLVAMWMFDQAKPSLAGLKKSAEHQKIVLAAQKEFAGLAWISQTRASQDGEPGPVSGNLVA
jgi:hypothetical protein